MEGLDRRKDAMIGALWSNPNWDDEKGTRTDAIESIEENYREAMKIVLGLRKAPKDKDEFTEEDKANPFLAPAIQATREVEVPTDPDGTVESNISAADLAAIDQ